MKFKFLLLLVMLSGGMLLSNSAFAQIESGTKTESSDPDEDAPLDDIVERTIMQEKKILAYDHLREHDIFWEKRIWRVIDVGEKINKTFVYPKAPFINILMDAAIDGEINVYSDEDFTNKLDPNEASSMGSSVDTVYIMDPETYEEKVEIVRNDLNWEDIKRFRVKEVWFFDAEASQLRVRILGISPLRDVNDDNGNFRYEQPMFWIYYPDCRETLARHKAFNMFNDAGVLSWEDLLEMRFFSSYVYKESNVYDRRLKDYKSEVDLLLEAQKIHDKIFNFEHDLWSY